MMPALGSKLQAGEEDKKIWIGNISIDHTLSQSYKIDKSTKFRKKISSKNHTLTDTVFIMFCVKDEKSCILKVDRYLNEKCEEKSFSQKDHEICPLTKEQMKHNFLYRAKHFKQEVKKPGDWGESSTIYTRNLYSLLPEPKWEDQTAISLVIFPGGDYHFSVDQDTYVDFKYDEKSELHRVCSGTERIVETHIKTGKIGDEPKATKVGSGEGEDSHTIINSVMPPITKTLKCDARGKVEGNKISGSKIMWETKAKKATDKNEKCVAHWELRFDDPMHYMVECLTFAEESLDRELQACFKKLSLQDGDCDRAELIKCFMSRWDQGGGGDPDHLEPPKDFSHCIDAWCGYTGNVNPSPELKKALHECIGRALLNYEQLLAECNMYGSCDICLK